MAQTYATEATETPAPAISRPLGTQVTLNRPSGFRILPGTPGKELPALTRIAAVRITADEPGDVSCGIQKPGHLELTIQKPGHVTVEIQRVLGEPFEITRPGNVAISGPLHLDIQKPGHVTLGIIRPGHVFTVDDPELAVLELD